MSTDISISFIIPAHNAEQTIKKCINSILKQDIRKSEIIVVDDGSSDNTLQILRDDYKRINCITILSQKNSGVSAARNLALSKANGEWIIFLDSDDWLEENAAESLARLCDHEDVDFIITRMSTRDNQKFNHIDSNVYRNNKGVLIDRLLFEEGKIAPGKYEDAFHCRGIGGKIIRRSIIVDNSVRFPTDTSMFEDGIFNLQCMFKSNSILCASEVFYHYFCDNPHSRTKHLRRDTAEEYMRIHKHLLKILKANNYESNAINNLALFLLIPSLNSAINNNEAKEADKLLDYYLPYLRKSEPQLFPFVKRAEYSLATKRRLPILIALLRLKARIKH